MKEYPALILNSDYQIHVGQGGRGRKISYNSRI